MDLNFVFESIDYLQNKNGIQYSSPNFDVGQAIKVEPNLDGLEGNIVTFHNLGWNHPDWRINIQMFPKQMKVIQKLDHKIVFQG